VAGARAKGISGAELIVHPATGCLPIEALPEKPAADGHAFLSEGIHLRCAIRTDGPARS